jgi:hypothetical protein
MIVGLTGAHRSGKTTLGTEFVKRNKQFTFAATSVSAIMKHYGFDPQLNYSFADRIRIQELILDELDAFYGHFPDKTIFDRTPLDAAAYLLADIQRQGVSIEDQERVVAYLERCFDITNRRFTMLLFIPSVIKPVEDADKAPATPGYIEHISALINGLKADQRMKVKHWSLPRGYVDLDLRVRAMESATASLLANYMKEVEFMTASGFVAH